MRNAIIILLLLVSPLSAAYRATNYDGSLSSGAPGSRTGCVLGYASASTVTISPGTANHASGSYTVATTITLDITDGDDMRGEESEAVSTWYYVYLTSATTGEISASAPTVAGGGLDSSDTSKVYLGCFLNDDAGAIEPFDYVAGAKCLFQSATADMSLSSSGDWADLDVSAHCPPLCVGEYICRVDRDESTDGWSRIAFKMKGTSGDEDWYVSMDSMHIDAMYYVRCRCNDSSVLQYNRESTEYTASMRGKGFIDRWLP